MEDSDDYNSPRAMPRQTRKRYQSPVVRLDSDESKKDQIEAPRGNTQIAEGSCSSTDEDSSKSKSKKKSQKKGTKPKATKLKTATTVANIEELRAQRAGKPGRPPTTGEYVKLAETKKAANDEKERERHLEMEGRIYSMEETLDILRRARLDPEDKKWRKRNWHPLLIWRMK